MIERFHNTFFSRKFLISIISLLAILYLISLYHRYLQQDEPWFGEQAYWLVKEGNVKLKSMPGVFNWSSDMLIFHKLFVWTGALLITLFGWNVYIFKTFIFLLFLACIYFVYRFSKQYLNNSSQLALLILVLFLGIPELIHRSFMFRPEVMVMTLGFLSFVFLYQSIENKKVERYILGAVFAGLAFLTHLNALVFPIAGFLFLLFFRQWKGLVIYSVTTGLVCSIYSIGLWDMDSIETYKYQMQHWPTHQDSFGEKIEGGIFGIIWNNIARLLNEHKRYFWDQDVWGVSGLFILALITRFRLLKQQYYRLLAYTIILIITVGVFTSGHSPRYLVYLMPFMVMITGLVIYHLRDSKSVVVKTALTIAVVAHFVFAGMSFVKIYGKNSDFVASHEQLLARLEPCSRILAPWEFIYNGIGDYEICSFKTYEYIEDQEKRKLSQKELMTIAAEFGMDYIVVDTKRKNDKNFPWFKEWEITKSPYYKEYFRTEEYLVLKKN
ncbi:glycosyltransferase family 39 protein [Fulvivirga sp. 29W222]|uniref:Glycosyltransferase family 39 protein n=1 Tax=Fulvivirga marina TaxID=2494733 RepID=A0A937G131_9BACT|nr:glycosyltransferase family 39 protein [Fulvivirga marina]MBL6446561.1 glycosyltransferase family 39 protein [Fulvivirga marina]